MQVETITYPNIEVKNAICKKNSIPFLSAQNNTYSTKEKLLVGTTTALGVLGSVAILAKRAGYGINPIKAIKNIKNSYLGKVEFKTKEIIGIGAGSCLGGLVGGYIIDKDKDNRKAKLRECVMQIGNISVPIITVDVFADKIFKNSNKYVKAFGGIAGLFLGVYLANFLMNKLSNVIFKTHNERKVKASDYSAHVDDMVVAAQYISKAKIIHYISRIIPIALMCAGNEVGNKQAPSYINKYNV